MDEVEVDRWEHKVDVEDIFVTLLLVELLLELDERIFRPARRRLPVLGYLRQSRSFAVRRYMYSGMLKFAKSNTGIINV